MHAAKQSGQGIYPEIASLNTHIAAVQEGKTTKEGLSFPLREGIAEENTHEDVPMGWVTVLKGRDGRTSAGVSLVGKSANITCVVAVRPLFLKIEARNGLKTVKETY